MSLDRPGNHGAPTEGAEVAVLLFLTLFCSCPSVRWIAEEGCGVSVGGGLGEETGWLGMSRCSWSWLQGRVSGLQ